MGASLPQPALPHPSGLGRSTALGRRQLPAACKGLRCRAESVSLSLSPLNNIIVSWHWHPMRASSERQQCTPVGEGLVPRSSPQGSREAGRDRIRASCWIPCPLAGRLHRAAWERVQHLSGKALALAVAGRWGKAIFLQILLESMCLSTGHLDAPADAHVPCQEIWW